MDGNGKMVFPISFPGKWYFPFPFREKFLFPVPDFSWSGKNNLFPFPFFPVTGKKQSFPFPFPDTLFPFPFFHSRFPVHAYYWFDLLTSQMASTQVIDRRRGATLILPALPIYRDGPSRGWHRIIMRALFCAMGILHGTTS